MATRWNGTDLQEARAFEDGLSRRHRGPKSKDKEKDIFYHFELMRRIRKIAQQMSRRDDELIEAVLRYGTLSAAARELAPERAEVLRCYLSQRLKKFKELAELFFSDQLRSKDVGPDHLQA